MLRPYRARASRPPSASNGLMPRAPHFENGGDRAWPNHVPFRQNDLGQRLLGTQGKKPSRLLQLCVALLMVSIFTACSKTSPRADATRGQQLYQFHCAPCHEMPPPDLLKEPPKLKGLFNSKTLPSGAPATDEQVRMIIVDGLRTMPAFQGRLQEPEIRDLIAYLHKM